MLRFNKQLTSKLLITYMISALLFLTSFNLHIHTPAAAAVAEHGAAVSITSLSLESISAGVNDEINVSPDGVTKLQTISFDLLALFLLITWLALFSCYSCVFRIRQINALFPFIPFFGAPSMRAPPVLNS